MHSSSLRAGHCSFPEHQTQVQAGDASPAADTALPGPAWQREGTNGDEAGPLPPPCHRLSPEPHYNHSGAPSVRTALQFACSMDSRHVKTSLHGGGWRPAFAPSVCSRAAVPSRGGDSTPDPRRGLKRVASPDTWSCGFMPAHAYICRGGRPITPVYR